MRAATFLALLAFQTAGAARPALFPGGVVDVATSIAVLETTEGLTAIDAMSGRELWRTALAFRPLLAGSGEVISFGMVPGRADAVRIVRLELATGRLKSASQPIVLPNWVVPDDPDPRAFAVAVQRHQSRLSMSWRATREDSRGAPPGLPVEHGTTASARGTVIMDLSSGAVTQRQLDREESLGPPPPTSAPYLRNGVWHRQAWTADGSERLFLRSKSGTLELVIDENKVVLGRLSKPVATVTADGRHVLVHADAPNGGGEWLIFSAATGEHAGTAIYNPTALDPVVIGDRLFYLVRRDQNSGGVGTFALEARRVGSQDLLWSIPITRRTLPSALPR